MTIGRVFGLTGGIASGKSQVSHFYRSLGIPVVDADMIAREVVRPGTPGLAQIVAKFGRSVLDYADTLDRAKLRTIIFADAKKRHTLNQIMQPLICQAADAQIEAALDGGASTVCFDAALIVEWGVQRRYRPLVVVACSRQTQLRRLKVRSGLNDSQALAMIEAQLPLEAKVQVADYVIPNDKDNLEDLHSTALAVLGDIQLDKLAPPPVTEEDRLAEEAFVRRMANQLV